MQRTSNILTEFHDISVINISTIFKTYFTVLDGGNKAIPDCIPQVVIHQHNNYGGYHIQPKHSYWSNIRAYVKKRKTKCK